MSTYETSFELNQAWTVCLMVLIAAVVVLAPDLAMAGGTKIAEPVDEARKMVTGPVGKAVATAAIVVVGVGALLGKMSWGMAAVVAAGIGIVFGAEAICGTLKCG